jgi:hypothetical protein
MISKGVKQLLKINQAGLINTQARAMGGGEKKPNMPAAETNFDVVLVGKYFYYIFGVGYLLLSFVYRWIECCCIDQVYLN